MKQIRRSTCNGGNTKIHHPGGKLLCITGRHGHYSCTKFLCISMSSQTACKQTLTICNLNDIISGNTCHGKCSRNTFASNLQITSGISNYSSLTRDTAGRMNTYNFRLGNRKQSERIIISQVCFCGKKGHYDIHGSLFLPIFAESVSHLCSYIPLFHSKSYSDLSPFVSQQKCHFIDVYRLRRHSFLDNLQPGFLLKVHMFCS